MKKLFHLPQSVEAKFQSMTWTELCAYIRHADDDRLWTIAIYFTNTFQHKWDKVRKSTAVFRALDRTDFFEELVHTTVALMRHHVGREDRFFYYIKEINFLSRYLHSKVRCKGAKRAGLVDLDVMECSGTTRYDEIELASCNPFAGLEEGQVQLLQAVATYKNNLVRTARALKMKLAQLKSMLEEMLDTIKNRQVYDYVQSLLK